ncbi:MAG: Gfo/Idh/MocA family oxidoreductase [Pirellulales bacterium]|nr:Gfo/Idh/MocA family oxidoreductase [Pirellulales bacterium]
MKTTQISRRRFVKKSAATIAAVGAPTFIPSYVLGQHSPSNTLQIGAIGTGRMGHGDMRACLEQGLHRSASARIVAVCDVDRHRAEHASRAARRFYAERQPDRREPAIGIFGDYRELLARDDIDGVLISTPDHWHAIIAVAAAEARKDAYVQKPLTYTIAEGQKLVTAVRQNNVILQTGSQQRSTNNFRRACELVRNGRIGKLHTIRVLLPADSGVGDGTPMKVPKHLDYEMWLGPTPHAPYAEHRVHPHDGFSRPGWLQIEPYCRGMITGWGSHMFDIAQWAHGSDDSGPIEMAATAEFPDRGLFNVHTKFHAEGRYADGVKLLAETGTPAGVTFEGDQGTISIGRGHFTAEPKDILRDTQHEGEIHLYKSDNHMLNFLQCMRTRVEPICPVEVGHRSNSICVIAHLAMKLGRKLRWNPQIERFLDDDAANVLLDYVHRPPWTI